jgi:zinc transport system ATP-binding protein
MSAPARALLEVESLTVRRGGGLILENVSFQVEPGAIHVLAGPNGAGKTTLLRSILGQVPFEGTIRLHWRGNGRIGYVPQTLELDRELPMTVSDFLSMVWQRRPVCLGSGGPARDRVEEALRKAGLADRARRRLGVLSGGELKRVLLVQALFPAPELLLLDEPSAGVDESSLQWMEETIQSLRRDRGLTTVLVSHDFDQARRIADQVTWVNRTVKKSGPAKEVLA